MLLVADNDVQASPPALRAVVEAIGVQTALQGSYVRWSTIVCGAAGDGCGRRRPASSRPALRAVVDGRVVRISASGVASTPSLRSASQRS